MNRSSAQSASAIYETEPQTAVALGKISTLLPAERSFIREDSVDLGTLSMAIEGENFAQIIAVFEEQMRNNPLAQKIHDEYAPEVSAALENNGKMKLDKFACGVRICVGSAHFNKANPGADEIAAEWFQTLAANGLTRMFGTHEIEGGEGQNEQRFFFSTDPALDSVFSPPNQN